jgi:predicted nucleic acid-binding protein
LPKRKTLHAPHLIDLEVVQILRRYNARGELTSERGLQAIEDYLDLSIERYPHDLSYRASGNFEAASRLTTLPTSRWPRH